jgi:putative membrane protein
LIQPPNDAGDRDPTRRTLLAAERTWLAWWRSGIATATAAVAVGGVVPELIDSARTPWIVLGAGYAALAVCVFVGGGLRQRSVERALTAGRHVTVGSPWVAGLTLAATVLALATLALIVIQP